MARLLLRAGTMTLLLHFALARADAADLSFADAVRRAAGETARSRMVTADADLLKAEARSAAAWTNPEIGARQEPDQGSVDVLVPLDIGAIGRGAVVPDAVKAADVRERAGRAAVGAAGGAAWLDARRATDISQLTRASEALSTRLATAAQGRVASGEWSPDEGALVRADAAKVLDRSLTWQQEARNATARLAVVLGVPSEGLTLGGWPDVARAPALDAATLPAVIVADLDARVALGNLHAERLARIPTLQLNGGYIFRGPIGLTYGASIAVPLFAPGAARVQGASARAAGSAATADLARLDASATVLAAQAEIDIAERLAAAWDIPGLDAALTATVRRYDAGELSLPDYLARRDLAVEAEQNAVDARWRLARARLAAWELAGELPTGSRSTEVSR